ncbi:MAG: zeta toxin family protein [Parcubacteria group bacterium]|nr:zeta toxin family protein [Parcubacteria group bacterium]
MINIKEAEEAKKFIKKNRKLLIEKFAKPDFYKSIVNPVTIFMAGSPGAGKTEFSKNLAKILDKKLVRIDADEIKEIMPQYNGKNSDVVQGASSIGVEKLYDHILAKKLEAIVDGTFSKYDVSYKNVKRSLDHSRPVVIFYIYQDPIIAWDFTKKREALEGRMIPKSAFIEAFFAAKENVNKIKEIFRIK